MIERVLAVAAESPAVKLPELLVPYLNLGIIVVVAWVLFNYTKKSVESKDIRISELEKTNSDLIENRAKQIADLNTLMQSRIDAEVKKSEDNLKQIIPITTQMTELVKQMVEKNAQMQAIIDMYERQRRNGG